MNEYIVKQKTYVKSRNSIYKIMNNYFISLIIYIILTIIFNLILKNNNEVISLLKSISISLITSSILAYIINIIKKRYNFIDIYKEDNIHIIALIIGIIGINTKLYILLIAIIITLIIKNVSKNINISSTLYGILIILIYKYYLNNEVTPLIELHKSMYTLSYKELFKLQSIFPSIISIIGFIYLFHKKSIKYNLVFTYILTIFIVISIISIIKHQSIYIPFFELLTGNLFFLSTFALTDYKASPTIKEGQVLYGIIIGTLTAILRFIIPELAVAISLALGIIILKPIEKISPKLKYKAHS